jgi:hypothetical protein
LPHGTLKELRHLAHDIAPDLTNQPSSPICRGTTAYDEPLEFQMPVQKPYESDHDFGLRVLCEKCQFQKEMSRHTALIIALDGKEREP